MTTMTEINQVNLTTQVYQVFIKATPEQIWEAIINPEFTTKYFYGARIEVTPEWRRTYSPDGGDDWGEGAVMEFDPPRRLVHEWRSGYNPELAAEEPSRVTWEIEEKDGGLSLLTVVHDKLEGAPKTAASVAGPGWMMVLSGMKTLLETGKPLTS
jgi:uncharacterized protein YndB with AHSA1/START domain